MQPFAGVSVMLKACLANGAQRHNDDQQDCRRTESHALGGGALFIDAVVGA
jgi:hypothetical protein